MNHHLVASMLLVGSAGLPAVATASATDGQALFKQRCSACHSAEGGTGVGPALNGVVGRKAASLKGYAYSAALTKSGKVWTEPALDAFLAAPTKVVPGSRMVTAVPGATQRADIIAYLRGLK